MPSTWNVFTVAVNAAAAASAVASGSYPMQMTPPKSANEQMKLLGDFSPNQSNDFSPEQGNDNLHDIFNLYNPVNEPHADWQDSKHRTPPAAEPEGYRGPEHYRQNQYD
eukprot:880206-Ditylum_brightwellii.AAC.1